MGDRVRETIRAGSERCLEFRLQSGFGAGKSPTKSRFSERPVFKLIEKLSGSRFVEVR